jgi:DNA repair protein REV1
MGSRLDANSSAVRKQIDRHVFDNEEGEEYAASTFAGFGDYMRRKKLKLQNLDAETRSSSQGNPPIFRDVVVHVNGYTQPSLRDLHHLIVSHGGGFLQYLDGKTSATHIVASTLTPKKREEFCKYRIVKPAWVVESVMAGRLLPWNSFRLLDEGHSQKVLHFDNGRFMGHVRINDQQSYKAESKRSWYTSQARGMNRTVPGTHPSLPASTASEVLSVDSTTGGEMDGEIFSPPGREMAADDVWSTRHQENAPWNDVSDSTLHVDPNSPRATGVRDNNGQLPPLLVDDAILSKTDVTPEEYNAQLLCDPRMKNSSVNPEFLQQYYRESRLHHLSTWKAELKAKLQATAQEKSSGPKTAMKRAPGARRYVLHVDFDCFFAAVSIRKNNPELVDKPVAVAHSAGASSEISCCNYPARAYGIKNGMWMKGALQMCPELKVLPYDFPAYEEASRKFYSGILDVDGIIQSVSIDEALIDITMQCLEAGGTEGKGIIEGSIYREQARADEIAKDLRLSIMDKTGCAVSVGIGGNILRAKIALRKAKPAGQFQLKPEDVLDFIGNLKVQDLPGVAYSLGAKLEELGVQFVKDLREISRERLTSSLGPKTGAKLWDYAKGIDRAEVGVLTVRKSVSAEINWGIRFVTEGQAETFLQSLSDELHRRLVENLVKGTQLSIRIMRRSADAPLEPVKHLGHGKCDVFNKSVGLGVATNAAETIGKEAVSMLRSFGFSPGDLRGLGIQMTKLEPITAASTGKPESGQRQLNFKASPVHKKSLPSVDPDEVESPGRGDDTELEVSEPLGIRPSLNDSTQTPLNTSGTQFILPSQADPKVAAELPVDIRSCLVRNSHKRSHAASPPSPSPASRFRPKTYAVELPPQSQLDPDILDALPDDLRAEILAYYQQPSEPNRPQIHPPTVQPRSSESTKMKKAAMTMKKRRGRPPMKPSFNSTLTQSNFIRTKPSAVDSSSARSSRQSSPSAEQDGDISADFLAALPDDIRCEVLGEQERTRLQHHSEFGDTASRDPLESPSTPPGQRRLCLPPLRRKPVFTSKKLSTLPELREALTDWYSSFVDEGPFLEDVTVLARYLKRVVLEERDIDKAVSVANWLSWLIIDRAANSRPTEMQKDVAKKQGIVSDSSNTWSNALKAVQESVASAVEERGLPPIEFL